MRALIVILAAACFVTACGDSSDSTATGDGEAPAADTTDGDAPAPAGGGTDGGAGGDGSAGDLPPIVGQLACEDPGPDGVVQLQLEGADCVADRTEQCSIVDGAETGLIRLQNAELRWDDRDAATLALTLDGAPTQVTVAITGTGPAIEFSGEVPDGRAITGSVNCESGP